MRFYFGVRATCNKEWAQFIRLNPWAARESSVLSPLNSLWVGFNKYCALALCTFYYNVKTLQVIHSNRASPKSSSTQAACKSTCVTFQLSTPNMEAIKSLNDLKLLILK